jgi:hypothetical protein
VQAALRGAQPDVPGAAVGLPAHRRAPRGGHHGLPHRELAVQHWERFAATSRYGSPAGQILPDLPNPYCGNAHFPSNAQSHYDYANPRQKGSICSDWGNFPNYTNSVDTVTCSNWGCSDNGWGEYWLGAVPTGIGTVGMTSVNSRSFAFPRDWWNLLLNADAALQFAAGL